ncbi:MAG TPA: DUF4287 domain-containing protein [Jiangellaceae bacterium]|nr:DUF4287 domain-containing protein [Jiangellaceae bacterium]
MSSGIERATGRDRDEWFGVLDDWGAPGRPYREIASWLTGEHGMSSWWAQKLIVEYEQARGLREPGVRRDGTFEVGASKTLAVPVERAYSAFTESEVRSRWLPGEVLTELAGTRPGKVARFGRADGTRVVAQFDVQSAGKCTVSVQHQRIFDIRAAEAAKAYWRERLSALKAMLEER